MAIPDKDKIRVLVVDDSAFMRRLISDILSSDSEISVVDTARNGQEALEKIKIHSPDIVTLDIEMPVMDGLTCLKEIHKLKNISVIMLSSITEEGASATMQALENGAIDFITKPANIFGMSGDDKKKEIIEKVKIAKNTNLKKVVNISKRDIKKKKSFSTNPNSDIKYLVAIGTSTGGPRALQDVIPLIPGDVPAAFVVVQHMPAGFTKSLADRLNNLSELTVKEAEDNEVIMPGVVYIAPGGYHTQVEKVAGSKSLRIKINQDPPIGGLRPSVNVMMNSIAKENIDNVIAVIMTGMGSDGSEGISNLKDINKAYTIAQDEKSCIVYGMPKIAVQTGAIDAVVPLNGIAREILKFMGVHK